MSEQTFQEGSLQANDGDGVIESLSACMVLSFLAVTARLVSRRIQNVKLRASDYLVIGGLIAAWVLTLITIEGRCSPVTVAVG